MEEENHVSTEHHNAAEEHHAPSGPGAHELFASINILVVAAIVIVFARKMIASMFKNRSQNMRQELVVAREELKNISGEIEAARLSLSNIEKERAELLRNVEQEGRSLAKKLVDDAKASATRILEDSGRAVEAEYSEIKMKLKSELLDALSEKVRAEFSSEGSKQKLHEKLIDSFTSNASSLTNGAKDMQS